MAAILRENEQMPWTELSGASFVFAFLDSRLCKQIGKNADVLFVCGYIMGLTLRCRRYIFLGSCLHLELLHGLLGLGNVDPIVVAAHLDSLLTFFFGKDTGFHGKSAFSFRNHSFSRIPNQIQVKVRKSLQILTVSVFYLAEWNFLPQALLRDMP